MSCRLSSRLRAHAYFSASPIIFQRDSIEIADKEIVGDFIVGFDLFTAPLVQKFSEELQFDSTHSIDQLHVT